jgi:hypothetical protein
MIAGGLRPRSRRRWLWRIERLRDPRDASKANLPRETLWGPSHLSQPQGGLGSRPQSAMHAMIDTPPSPLYTRSDVPLRTVFVSERSFLWLLNTRPVGPAGRSSGG